MGGGLGQGGGGGQGGGCHGGAVGLLIQGFPVDLREQDVVEAVGGVCACGVREQARAFALCAPACVAYAPACVAYEQQASNC